MKTKIKDNIIYLDEGRLEIFTPQKYMGRYNVIMGSSMKAFGLVTYKFYKNVSDTKPVEVGVLDCPSIITFYPVDIKNKVLDTIWGGKYDDLNENEYTMLTFEAGSKLTDQYIVQSLDNVVTMTNLVLNGDLDNNIPYPFLTQAWIKNMSMNDKSLNVPATTLNMVIAELCRSKHNQDVKFANVIGKNPKISPVSYVFTNIRNVCAANSVFSALTFEDMNAMLDASLNTTSTGREQKTSPMEQITKF